MARKDPGSGPSLELPSLFGRRKPRRADPGLSPDDPMVTGEPDHEQAAPRGTVEEPTVAPTPAVTPTTVPTPPPAPLGSPPSERAAGGRWRARTTRRAFPELAASTAVVVVGGVVGLLGCVLTFIGLRGCELVTGTDSCAGPGLLLPAVILVMTVLLVVMILRGLRVPEARGLSLLGAGMMAVVALLFLATHLYSPWMFVVVPVVTAVSFGVARWIITRYADDDDAPHHDVP